MLYNKELLNQYQITYLTLQKHLSNRLLEAKTEAEIEEIRKQRKELGETYEKTMAKLSVY